jgi:hypothetical protein
MTEAQPTCAGVVNPNRAGTQHCADPFSFALKQRRPARIVIYDQNPA